MTNNINDTQGKGFLSYLPNTFSTAVGTIYGATEPKATRQIVTSWKGNGLADIEPYLLDERVNRRGNTYDMSAMLSNMFGDSKGLLKGVFGKFGKFGKFDNALNGMTLNDVNNASSVFDGDIINSNGYNIPEGLSFLKPNISGTPTHVGDRGYDISLPTKSFDFSTNWFNKGNK